VVPRRGDNDNGFPPLKNKETDKTATNIEETRGETQQVERRGCHRPREKGFRYDERW
jgi:hypothetical protein